MYKRKYAHTYIFRETDKQADAVNMNRNFPRFPELCSPPPRMVYGRQMSASPLRYQTNYAKKVLTSRRVPKML